MEGFLSIHQLSTQFNVSARVIRGRLHKLIQAGKLAEGADFVRENYIDETHFEWRINPLTFMRAAGLVLAPVASQALPEALIDRPVNPVSQVGKPMDTQPVAPVTESDTQRVTTDNQAKPPVGKPVNQTDNQADSPQNPPSLWREFIDFLKGQIDTKDSQIQELTSQNRLLNDLNKNLVGQTVQLGERIQALMTLPPPPAPKDLNSIKVDDDRVTTDAHFDDGRGTKGYPDRSDEG
jgi:hypothetical protein